MLTLQKLYELAIDNGIKTDPRPKADIKRLLSDEKKTYEKLSKKEKDFFDKDRIKNPYSDTRILYGDSKKKVKKVAVGIDLEADALMLINELNRKGSKIDLALSHHPEGIALARLADVMNLQNELYAKAGVPINVIEKLMDKDIVRVQRSVHPINHAKNVDVARLLKIPYMCTHTVADNMAYAFLQKLFDAKKPRTLGDVCDILLELPEYKDAARQGVQPTTFVGSKKSRAGKVSVSGFTGGTSGSAEIYESMKHAGVGTEVVMHIKPESRKEAEKHHVNIVVAGHIASDSLGMNLLLDALGFGEREVVELGGFRRFSRKMKNKK